MKEIGPMFVRGAEILQTPGVLLFLVFLLHSPFPPAVGDGRDRNVDQMKVQRVVQ